MKTDELLKMQALKFKNEVMERNPDFENDESVPAWMRETYDATGEVRNICGMIPLSLFEEINRVSGILSISKRRIVEMALRDFAISANKALAMAGTTEGLPNSPTPPGLLGSPSSTRMSVAGMSDMRVTR